MTETLAVKQLSAPVLEDSYGLYGLTCSFYDSVMKSQFAAGTTITSTDVCTTGEALVAKACYNSGLDAYSAAACYAALPALWESTCTSAVTMLGAFTEDACALALGCPMTSSSLAVVPAKLASEDDVPCWVLDAAITAIFDVTGKITSQALCVADDAGVVAACEALGGPFDPFADACAVALGAIFETACAEAISQLGSFTGTQLEAAAGCSSFKLESAKLASEDDVPCWVLEPAITAIFDVTGKITSQALCVADDVGVAAACEALGGPFDPFADAC